MKHLELVHALKPPRADEIAQQVCDAPVHGSCYCARTAATVTREAMLEWIVERFPCITEMELGVYCNNNNEDACARCTARKELER